MSSSHVTGGVLGGALGIVLVGLLRHYGISSIDQTEASAVGVGFAGAGVAVAHAVWNLGLFPIIHRIIHGPDPAKQPITLTVPHDAA